MIVLAFIVITILFPLAIFLAVTVGAVPIEHFFDIDE